MVEGGGGHGARDGGWGEQPSLIAWVVVSSSRVQLACLPSVCRSSRSSTRCRRGPSRAMGRTRCGAGTSMEHTGLMEQVEAELQVCYRGALQMGGGRGRGEVVKVHRCCHQHTSSGWLPTSNLPLTLLLNRCSFWPCVDRGRFLQQGWDPWPRPQCPQRASWWARRVRTRRVRARLRACTN